MARRVSLVPDRMTTLQLYARCRSLVAAARFSTGHDLSTRERMLDELEECLRELELRGVQLELPM